MNKHPSKSPPRQPGPPVVGERLQKVLAAAGLGSRRQCETLILEGRVEVDRHVVTELGTRVDVDRQEVRVDGTALPQTKRVYYAVNKPAGVLSTSRDPEGRHRVIDLVPGDARLFAVGRLDMYSEGLILLTNDGELANRLTHPRFGVEKTYRVRVAGHPTPEQLAELTAGMHLAEGFVRAAAMRVRARLRQSTELELVLKEGKNREIRRLLARIGHKVMRLQRIAVGPIRLGDMPAGSYRRLTRDEVRMLEETGGNRTPHKERRPKSSGRTNSGDKKDARPSGAARPAAPRKPVPARRKAAPALPRNRPKRGR